MVDDISRDPDSCEYYVYVLIDPTKGDEVFYVGMGQGRRCHQHADDAGRNNGGLKLEELVDKDENNSDKNQRIQAILNTGYDRDDIARVVAWCPSADAAFFLESFMLKFVYDYNNLTNLRAERHHRLFRRHGDWTKRKGFDIPAQRIRAGRASWERVDDSQEFWDSVNTASTRLISREEQEKIEEVADGFDIWWINSHTHFKNKGGLIIGSQGKRPRAFALYPFEDGWVFSAHESFLPSAEKLRARGWTGPSDYSYWEAPKVNTITETLSLKNSNLETSRIREETNRPARGGVNYFVRVEPGCQ